MTTPNGFVEMTNDEYHAGPGISKSHLDKIAKSPRHYWEAYINPERERQEPTAAMILGTAIHTAVLEPDTWASRYAQAPEDINRRTKEGKERWAAFENENAGKVILDAEDWQAVLRVRDAVHTHPVAGPLLRGGVSEQTVYATCPETGDLIKCRCDYLLDERGMIVDLKSTEDASPAGFGKSVANFRYHLQPPWYQDVFRQAFGEAPPFWVFVAVEKSRPHAIGVYYVDPDMVASARSEARALHRRIVACREAGVWPDYGAEAQPLTLPRWYQPAA